MKQLKNIFTVLFATAVFASCSSDDNSGDNPVGGDHTYEVSITGGDILTGTNLSGTVSNEDFQGMYFDYGDTTAYSLSLGTTISDFYAGGAVVLANGQSSSQLNAEADTESGGSSLMITFSQNGQSYTFVSTSGNCTVSNLQTYGVTGGIGGASYKLTFTGTFREENFDGPDEDKPLVQMNGTLDIKKVND